MFICVLGNDGQVSVGLDVVWLCVWVVSVRDKVWTRRQWVFMPEPKHRSSAAGSVVAFALLQPIMDSAAPQVISESVGQLLKSRHYEGWYNVSWRRGDGCPEHVNTCCRVCIDSVSKPAGRCHGLFPLVSWRVGLCRTSVDVVGDAHR